jgi:release factor glutamine methyltransferase
MLGLYVRSLPLRGKRVLDLGTGSGVVGIHAERAGASVLAVDVNPLAVTAAKSNAHQNGCSAFEGRESDLFEEIGEDERFDLIAWNPPFYATDPTGTEDPAWFAGPGYERLRLLSAGADRHLLSGGSVLLVLSSDLDLPLLWGIFAGDAWKLSVVEIRPGFFADHLLLALRK